MRTLSPLVRVLADLRLPLFPHNGNTGQSHYFSPGRGRGQGSAPAASTTGHRPYDLDYVGIKLSTDGVLSPQVAKTLLFCKILPWRFKNIAPNRCD